MKTIILIIILFVICTGFIKKRNLEYQVIYIIDGDSIIVKHKTKKLEIRLAGIDAPEMPNQPYAKEAKTFLYNLIYGKFVTIKHYTNDLYDRSISEVFYNNANVNLLMIQSGLAEVYKGKSPQRLNINKYFNIGINVKRAGKGLWSNPDRVSPQNWRDN